MRTKLVFTAISILFAGLISVHTVLGQKGDTKKVITIANLDVQGLYTSPELAGNLLRIEVEKLDLYQVTDRYDSRYLLKKNKLKLDSCYGKICLIEAGKILQSDYMMSGSIENLGGIIQITLRLINVKNESIEKTHISEFLLLENELQNMVMLSTQKMFGNSIDTLLHSRLTKKFNLDNAVNNPYVDRLNLSGPRMGFTLLTGLASNRFQQSKDSGGFDAFPVMFQFGYQFEVQYLNEGRFQALFEFVPMITGLDQSLLIPSISIMNGLRDNIGGWEFAFGPVLSINRYAKGYFDSQNNWHLESEFDPSQGPMPAMETRMDSRGMPKLQSSFVIAAGKTFKSGKLNIPMNIFFIPDKDGFRYGFSFGYNAKK